MLFLISTIVTTVANLFLGILVHLRNPKGKANFVFFLLTISLAIWIITLYVYYTISDPHWLLWIGRANFAAPTLSVYFLCLFVYLFPTVTLKIPRWIVGLTTAVIVLSVALTMFTPYVDQHEVAVGSQRFMTFGILYPIWVIFIMWLMAMGLAILFIKRNSSDGAVRAQMKSLVLGLILAFLSGTVFNIILPFVFGIDEYQQFGPLGTLFLSGLTAYAMVRQKFLDVTSLLWRTFFYTNLLVVTILSEITFVWLFTKLIPSGLSREVVILIGATLIVIGYDKIRHILTRITSKIFFKSRYDTNDLLAELTKIMAQEIQIDELSKNLSNILRSRLKITRVNFVIRGEKGTESQFWNELVKNTSEKNELIFDDLDEGKHKRFMRDNDLRIIMRMKVKDITIGYLLLGQKASGDVYFDQDIELLRLFVPNAAIALNNANNYREIAKFNRTLEKKVEERTQELEISQREKLKKAAELLKLKDEFVFIATHDLASPITAISGYADLIRTSKEKMSKDLKENMEEIVTGASRLKDLVDDLLQVARSESGTIRVNLGEVDVVEVARQVASQVAIRAKEKQIKFTLKLDTKHKIVKGDRDKLLEVFENLFTNAVKYNKQGGSVEVSSKLVDKKLVIEVADTGYGIPKGEQDKVFSKFYRSESKAVRAEMGTGLGLFVVRMLVSKMGGKISFESTEGQGTTFRIVLNTI